MDYGSSTLVLRPVSVVAVWEHLCFVSPIFLSCHSVEPDAISNDNVLPEISCTTPGVISAKMAAGYLHVSRLVRLDGFRLPLTDWAFLDATRA